MVDSDLYINDNAWLDLTSSWSIKDIKKKFKTFPEVRYTSSASILLVWVIMELQAEDPRGKNNAFRITVYSSPEWTKMVSLGTFTAKDMHLKDVTSGEQSQPPLQSAKKKKVRKRKNCRAKSKVNVGTDEYDFVDNDCSSKLYDGQGVKSSSKPYEGA